MVSCRSLMLSQMNLPSFRCHKPFWIVAPPQWCSGPRCRRPWPPGSCWFLSSSASQEHPPRVMPALKKRGWIASAPSSATLKQHSEEGDAEKSDLLSHQESRPSPSDCCWIICPEFNIPLLRCRAGPESVTRPLADAGPRAAVLDLQCHRSAAGLAYGHRCCRRDGHASRAVPAPMQCNFPPSPGLTGWL